MKTQPKLPHGQKRRPQSACVDRKIKDAVRRDAMRWDCSQSWIVTTALAAFYGIDILTPAEAKKRRQKA